MPIGAKKLSRSDRQEVEVGEETMLTKVRVVAVNEAKRLKVCAIASSTKRSSNFVPNHSRKRRLYSALVLRKMCICPRSEVCVLTPEGFRVEEHR